MLLSDLIDYFKKDKEEELLAPIDLREESGHKSSFGTTLKSILKYFILNKDAHDMLHDLEEDYYDNNADVYRFIPLMFDLEMTFKNAYDDDDSKENLKTIATSFNTEHKNMVKKIDKLLKTADKGQKIFDASQSVNDSSVQLLKKINLLVKQLNTLSNGLSEDTKDSFKKQLDELDRLKISYGNDVFPFLATDPRRPGMGNKIQQRVGKGRTFHGIKLYTPNGYSPTDPHLFTPSYQFTSGTSLYQWCVDFDIPIMAHNSDAGFATFTDRLEVYGDICTEEMKPDGSYKLEHKNKEYIHFRNNLFKGGFGNAVMERAHTLNHPTLWRKVLTEYPSLKICLAHFGGGSEKWQKEIAQLILDFDNVYTDLSCQTNIKRLETIYQAYFRIDSSDNKKIRSRIMYGSDYFLNLLQGAKFDKYYANFKATFNPNELNYMSTEVPKSFLGIH